jgi:hypothetical protein
MGRGRLIIIRGYLIVGKGRGPRGGGTCVS